jgi:hypothetical protein
MLRSCIVDGCSLLAVYQDVERLLLLWRQEETCEVG